MGAGVPAEIPDLLDAFAAGQPGGVTISIQGAEGEATTRVSFDPKAVFGVHVELPRPQFPAIVSSNMLATYLTRETRTRPEGFVVEGFAAGGHSAPPRGPLPLDPWGQPAYGPRDIVELNKLRALGLPYWLAGGYASPQRLREAQHEGAAGIQVGSALALCDESGLQPSTKRNLREHTTAGTLHVQADPFASPTGFPFKVAHLPGTLADVRCTPSADGYPTSGTYGSPTVRQAATSCTAAPPSQSVPTCEKAAKATRRPIVAVCATDCQRQSAWDNGLPPGGGAHDRDHRPGPLVPACAHEPREGSLLGT